MHHFRAILPKCVLAPPKETSSHIFKITIFPKYFEAFMRQIVRQNTGKKIKKNPELFSNKIFEYSRVTFFADKTIAV